MSNESQKDSFEHTAERHLELYQPNDSRLAPLNEDSEVASFSIIKDVVTPNGQTEKLVLTIRMSVSPIILE